LLPRGRSVHSSYEPSQGPPLADLNAKTAPHATDEDRGAYIHMAMGRPTELSRPMKSQLKKPDWARKREIIRSVVQRIEIGPMNVAILLRLPTEKSVRVSEPIMVTLSRACLRR
jgi:hypothetical protein